MTDFNDPYSSYASLADAKSLKLEQRTHDKQKRLNPTQATDAERRAARLRMQGSDTGLADFAGSSLRQAGGNLLDALKGASNLALDTEFDDAGATGWSNPDIADALAGVSPEARAEHTQAGADIMADLADENYLAAALGVVKESPTYLAEQAGVLAELAGGSAIAAGGAFLGGPAGAVPGAAVLARRGKKIVEGVEKASELYDDAKALKQAKRTAGKFEKAARTVGKSQVQTGLLNADILQGIRNDYKAENNGEEPSFERMIGSGLVVAATTSFQPAIIKKFWLPQGKKFKGKTIKENFERETKAMLKYADQSLTRNVAETVAKGVTKVAAAAGAEGVQEYFQSWAEILSVKMDPEEAGGLLQAAFNEIASPENRLDATFGAFVGMGVGGAARAATAAPTAAVGVTADAALATAKYTGSKISDKYAQMNFAELSDAEKAELKADYETAKGVHTEFTSKMNAFRGELEKAESFTDITNEEIRNDIIQRAEGRDLSDPAEFKSMKKGMIRKYRSSIGISRGKLDAHHWARVAKKKGTRAKEQIVEKVEEYVDIEKVKEKAEQVAEQAVDLGDAAIEEIKNLDTSASVGLAEAAVEYSKDRTKKGWQKVKSATRNQTPKEIRRVAKLWDKDTPMRIRLEAEADRREEAATRAGLREDKLKTFGDLSEKVREVAQTGELGKNQPVGIAASIRKDMKGRLDDKASVEALTKALDTYEETDFHKNQESGALRPTDVKAYRKRLAKAKEQHATPVRDVVEGIATNLTKRAYTGVKAGVKATRDWVKDPKLPGDTEVEVKTDKEVFKVKASEAGKEFLDKLDAVAKEIGALDPKDQNAAVAATAKTLTTEKMMETYKNVFDTQDPLVIAQLLTASMPGVSSKLLLTELMKQTKGRPEPTATETVSEVKGEPVVPSGKIVLTEEGDYVIDKTISEEEFDEVMELFDGITICNK